MKDIIFYKDTLVGKEIAFVLGIEYKFVDVISKRNAKNNTIFIESEEDVAIAEKKGLVHKVDYLTLVDVCEYLDTCGRFVTDNRTLDINEINEIPNEYLCLSQMLIKVLYSTPLDIDCKSITETSYVDDDGNIWGCCPHWVDITFGNILYDNNPYDSYYARMIRLSELNKTYCFCNLRYCRFHNSKPLENYVPKEIKANIYPKQSTIAIDRTCNLRCNSCRKQYLILNLEAKQRVEKVTDKLIENGLLNKSDLLIAGQGEVFFSKNYEKILKSLEPRENIKILSNGVLFTEDKLNYLLSKFKNVHVSISVDAATKETYNKLRHGLFEKLLQNLRMLGKKRKENIIPFFTLNFIVQRDNMNEMIDFIKLAKEINVDKIQFTRLLDWKTLDESEYLEKCLIVDELLDYDLYKILQDPIFKDDIVDISDFYKYIESAKKYYGE